MNRPDHARIADVMKRDWDERARQDARWFINSLRVRQSDEEFDGTGRIEVERLVLADLDLLTCRRDPRTLSLLEIGCGAGRMTRHLAGIFGHVAGVDVSGEMIRQAGERLAGVENVRLIETSGVDFKQFPNESFDLIISAYVFQHVPSVDVIDSNLRDAWRVLKPGGMLRFQTNAISRLEFERIEKDTWTGAAYTEAAIRRFARERSAQLISIFGADTQYCWTTIKKRQFALAALAGDEEDRRPSIVFFGHTYDAERKDVPLTGDQASLTLILTGLDHDRDDCDSVTVRIGGERILPRYVGPIGGNFRSTLENHFGRDLSQFTQVEIGMPDYVSAGFHPVSVEAGNRLVSPAIEVMFSNAGAEIPRISSVSNAFDGGMDILSSGPKSRIQIQVEGMRGEALNDGIEVEIGSQTITPDSTGFLPEKDLLEIAAQLPAGLFGRVQIRVRIEDAWSAPAEISIGLHTE